jgi:hypothetical protein
MPLWPPDSPPPPEGIPQMPASGFDILAPYAAGSPDPVLAGGDADAGGRDDVAGDVAGAQAAAEARYHEHQSDLAGQGSQIGDAMDLPSQDFSVATAHATGYGGQQ